MVGIIEGGQAAARLRSRDALPHNFRDLVAYEHEELLR
jgi:hypothetical protein